MMESYSETPEERARSRLARFEEGRQAIIEFWNDQDWNHLGYHSFSECVRKELGYSSQHAGRLERWLSELSESEPVGSHSDIPTERAARRNRAGNVTPLHRPEPRPEPVTTGASPLVKVTAAHAAVIEAKQMLAAVELDSVQSLELNREVEALVQDGQELLAMLRGTGAANVRSIR